ncbi:hypothetical protein V8J88_05885 [Massilia sp. W12]|uniref:endonuclease/exonuclease/phosphatase family protein n=1 Tax=Massilia sp. W12 TaxID=3126507 RepID=UPI0030CFFAB3
MGHNSFNIAWWNTGLAPGARSKSAQNTLLLALGLIYELLHEQALDLLVLCEISETELRALADLLEASPWRLQSGLQSVGRARFDTCFVYREERLAIAGLLALTHPCGERIRRPGQHLRLLLDQRDQFHCFVSHWPSRVYADKDERNRLGMELRDEVNRVLRGDPEANIIMMGDYNDEVFDVSITEYLQASRDRELVLRKRHLLYNPFWRKLGASLDGDYFSGTIFDWRGEFTRWRSFDQIMLSAALLDGAQWRLDESSANIYSSATLSACLRKHEFDHLPVILNMQKVM